MTKRDQDLIAAAFAETERFNEALGANDNGLVASTLRILADDIAGRIKAEHPRFRAGVFVDSCFPIASERRKQSILAVLAKDPA